MATTTKEQRRELLKKAIKVSFYVTSNLEAGDLVEASNNRLLLNEYIDTLLKWQREK